MIDQLHNCPNCGAILDDTGRCNFCGSKVYDLCDIDVSNNRGIKYIRIKTNEGMIVAPIVFNTVSMECHAAKDITISTEFIVVGNVIYEKGGAENEKEC